MAQKQDRGAGDKRSKQAWAGKLAIVLACFGLLAISILFSTRNASANPVAPDRVAIETIEVQETPESLESPTVEETVILPTATAPTSNSTPTDTEEPNSTETPEQTATTTTGWEEQTLLELADHLGWPASVLVDENGRSLVQLVLDTDNWAQSSIRPFTYGSSAEAAFAAEQEDASLSGYSVQTNSFYTYPAYEATLLGPNGTVIEHRLRWLAENRILGVAIHGTSPAITSMDVDTVAHELLLLAINHGLPTPVGGFAPTPLPPTQGTTPSATATPDACSLSFPDVGPNYWAYRYISDLACQGVVSGRSNGMFYPDSPTTRAQITKMIVLSEGWPLLNPAQPSFRDIGPSHVFYRYIETAYARGILSGYANKTFRPDLSVTRAQVAKMLVLARAWPLTLHGESPVPLCDVPAQHWAWIYVQVAFQHSAFSGYANGCFLPDASATRSQIAKVLVQSHR